MNSFTGLCRKVVNGRYEGFPEMNMDFVFVNSRYVVVGVTPTLARVGKMATI